MTIGPFRDDYRWLSNFWYATIVFGSNSFKTNEHLYQAMKTVNPDDLTRILRAETPKDAKDLGAIIELDDDWENRKNQVMLTVTVLKYTQNIDLAIKLMKTGDEEIVEFNHWCDNYWGVCNCKKCDGKLGENHLGKTIMEVRDLINKMYG